MIEVIRSKFIIDLQYSTDRKKEMLKDVTE